MPEMRACHLRNTLVFFCIGIDHHGTEIAAELTGPGGGQ